MFASLLPENVAVTIASEEMGHSLLGDKEEARIANAVPKRQREYRSGRNAARAALQTTGYSGDMCLLAENDNRYPNWPKGYIGSITHTQGFCATAVGSTQDYRGIGIDAEPRTPLKPQILPRICTAREQTWIEQQSDSSLKPYWGVIFFCIKETLYKVFNPIHHVFLGFQEAEVFIDPEQGLFYADVFQEKEKIACRYHGKFSTDDGFIYAVTLLET